MSPLPLPPSPHARAASRLLRAVESRDEEGVLQALEEARDPLPSRCLPIAACNVPMSIQRSARDHARTSPGRRCPHLQAPPPLPSRAQGSNINCKDWAGRTPLHLAARSGQLALAKLLIGLGSDVKAKCKGLPVIRGAHWDRVVDGDSDGGRGNLGFAVSQDNGWCSVTWTGGGVYLYKINPAPGKFTLSAAETMERVTEAMVPKDLTPMGTVQLASAVKGGTLGGGGAPPARAAGAHINPAVTAAAAWLSAK